MTFRELLDILNHAVYKHSLSGDPAFTREEQFNLALEKVRQEVIQALSDRNTSLELSDSDIRSFMEDRDYMDNKSYRKQEFIVARCLANSSTTDKTSIPDILNELYFHQYPVEYVENPEIKTAYSQYVQEQKKLEQERVQKEKEAEERRELLKKYPWINDKDTIKNTIQDINSQSEEFAKEKDLLKDFINNEPDKCSYVMNMYLSVIGKNQEYNTMQFNPLDFNLTEEELKDKDQQGVLAYCTEQTGLSYRQMQSILRYDYIQNLNPDVTQEQALDFVVKTDRAYQAMGTIRENGVGVAQLTVKDVLKAMECGTDKQLDEFSNYLAIKNWIHSSSFDYETDFTPEVMDVLYKNKYKPEMITEGDREYSHDDDHYGVEKMRTAYSQYIKEHEKEQLDI